jgi:glucokinase
VLNDVRAGALAELRLGALRDHDPGIYLSLGTGVAAALTVGGTVLAGFDGAAGEIGYMVVPGAATAAIVTPRDSHDLTLEPLVGGKALGERASVLLGEEITARALFARSDRPARRIVEQALEILGGAIANLAVFVNPRRVVIGGGMMSSADVVLPAIAERIKAIVPFPPDVVPARFTEDASLHGAIALALEHVDPSPLPSFRESAPCS